jgi:hypothetical protein
MFAAGRMVLLVFLGSHGTLVAVSAPFMMPLCDSDIPMNVPFTFSNKQPLSLIRRVDRSPARPDGAHCCGPLRLHGGVELLHGKSGGGLLCRCHVARLGPRHDQRVASPALRCALPRSPLRTPCISSEAELERESTKIRLGMTGSLHPKAEL